MTAKARRVERELEAREQYVTAEAVLATHEHRPLTSELRTAYERQPLNAEQRANAIAARYGE